MPLCEKFGFGVYRMPELVSSFIDFLMRFQDPVHGPDRTQICALIIQQGESLAYERDQLGHHSILVTVDVYGTFGSGRK